MVASASRLHGGDGIALRMGPRPLARQHHRTADPAHRRGDMRIAETHPLRRKTVHRGCLHDGMPGAALRVKALGGLGKEKENVRA